MMKASTRKSGCGQLRSDNGHPAKVFTRSGVFLPPRSFELFLHPVVPCVEVDTIDFLFREATGKKIRRRTMLVEKINENRRRKMMRWRATRGDWPAGSL